jgi:hypothetical protein
MFMQIIIEPANGNRYKGTLFIDGEVIETTLQPRAGCCTRTLMNKIMFLYGKPENILTIDIEGW